MSKYMQELKQLLQAFEQWEQASTHIFTLRTQLEHLTSEDFHKSELAIKRALLVLDEFENFISHFRISINETVAELNDVKAQINMPSSTLDSKHVDENYMDQIISKLDKMSKELNVFARAIDELNLDNLPPQPDDDNDEDYNT